MIEVMADSYFIWYALKKVEDLEIEAVQSCPLKLLNLIFSVKQQVRVILHLHTAEQESYQKVMKHFILQI